MAVWLQTQKQCMPMQHTKVSFQSFSTFNKHFYRVLFFSIYIIYIYIKYIIYVGRAWQEHHAGGGGRHHPHLGLGRRRQPHCGGVHWIQDSNYEDIERWETTSSLLSFRINPKKVKKPFLHSTLLSSFIWNRKWVYEDEEFHSFIDFQFSISLDFYLVYVMKR